MKTTTAPRSARSREVVHLGPSHPLAEVAVRHCRRHTGPYIGDVACGVCWELAIRDDERLVVECDLPREIESEPDYVDEIAVSLACRGERVALTSAEFAEAVHRLRGRGMFPIEIARRLHVVYAAVTTVLTASGTSLPATGRAA